MLTRSLRQVRPGFSRTIPVLRSTTPALRQITTTPEAPDTRHFKKPAGPTGVAAGEPESTWDNPMSHAVWSVAETEAVKKTHHDAKDLTDSVAYYSVKAVRFLFDLFSGYSFGDINTTKVLRRVVFLETVAGVPGFAAAIIRHLGSLRTMRRDYGWIHTLLEEAENERMHLLTFIQLQTPGALTRLFVLLAQGIFMNAYFLVYLLYPKICHRFVGYLEEEAVKTYTDVVQALDDGKLPEWKDKAAPEIAINYWRLPKDAKMRDLLMAVRADEAVHRDVNHVFASIGKYDRNPYIGDPKGPLGLPKE